MNQVDFDALQKTIAQVGEIIATKRALREELAEDRDRIAAQPFCRNDLIQVYDDWVVKAAGLYQTQLLESAKAFNRHPERGLPPPAADVDRLGLLAGRDKSLISVNALLALCAPIIREQLAALLQELPLEDEAAMPLAERERRLNVLDEQIDSLDKEIAQISFQAASAGLSQKQRRMPTHEEIEQAFRFGRPSNPAAYAQAIENLTRRLNNEPLLPTEPLPSPPARLVQEPEMR